MPTINYEQNVKYFKTVSYKPGIVLIVVGVLLLFTGSTTPVMIGLLSMGIGGFLIYNQVADRSSDEEIDRQVSAVISDLEQRAVAKLGLDPDEVNLIDPIVVGGNVFGSLDSRGVVRKGKDGRFRSSTCEGVVIFFGEQELHAYKYQVSLIAQNESSEQTDVYFYRDVVSVSTKSTSIPVSVTGVAKQQIVQFEQFTLTTSGGTNIDCAMGATANSMDRDIQGARQLIRNKKMHTP